MLTDHLKIFGAPHVAAIPGLRRGWAPGGVRGAGLSLSGVSEFPRIYDNLFHSGMIQSPTPWPSLTEQAERDHVMELGQHLHADMYEVTHPSQSLRHLPERQSDDAIQLFPLETYPLAAED